MKRELKVGDRVRIRSINATGQVEKVDGNQYLIRVRADKSLWYSRSFLRKLPDKLSPASELAGQNNYWQGRARSVMTQLDSLARLNPAKVFDDVVDEELERARCIVVKIAKLVEERTKLKLQNRKGAPNV